MNAWCEALGIAVPSLAAIRGHREANTFSRIMVVLLERGSAMTLPEIAERFVAADVFTSLDEALTSIKRCRPARPPIYRDGELYSLDPHDDDLDLWVFRLGLRPPKFQTKEPPPPTPLPARRPSTERLTIEELDLAWRDASLNQWSMQRLALAVLDAHDGPMTPDDVVAFVAARTKWHRFKAENASSFHRKNSAVAVGTDGRWSIVEGAAELAMTRDAVRDVIQKPRPPRFDPDDWDANKKRWDQEREKHANELAALRRVIVVHFKGLVTLLDLTERRVWTVPSDQVDITQYDVLCGDQIRTTLRTLGIDPGTRRLSELGCSRPTAKLVYDSCGLKLIKLEKLSGAKLTAALESNARALFAFHEYGKLHGRVRISVSRTEYEMLPAPWHHRDEPNLYSLMKQAFEMKLDLIAVVGPAPSWDAPWERAETLIVRPQTEYSNILRDVNGEHVDEHDVQLARLELTLN